ncbi:MAG: hypothetical protein MUO76_12430, partial [Anaerolineaceae bacterium]|nr:hypothetical protein [Anaerolineaceae bacterium]
MPNKIYSRISRLIAALAAAVILVALIPGAVYAANVPILSFTTIKVGESVTVHGEYFPKDTNFTVRMDKIGNMAVNGLVVGFVDSNIGRFDTTFNIPGSQKSEPIIAMRMDSKNGWYSYNWFSNKST